MATNCLAPGYIKLFYTSNGHPHVMTLPVKPASVAVNYAFNLRGGGTVSQTLAVQALVTLLVPFFAEADSFTGWEAYTQADCASAPVFQNNGTLVGYVGTNGGDDTPWVQGALTFKSSSGGRARFQFMEAVVLPDQKIALAGIGAGSLNDLADYLTGSSGWVAARDNGYPSVQLNYVTKTNDQLRKKYLNP